MQVQLMKLKFKEGGKNIWLDWSEELKRRKEEVIKTLKNEGVISEACFISKNGEDVFYFLEAKDIKRAEEVFSKSNGALDIEHKKKSSSSLEFIEKLDILFHFEVE